MCLVGFVPAGAGQPGEPAAAPLDWRTLEAGVLSGHVQLTSRDAYTRAGEAYFSPDGLSIIFQATAVPPAGMEPSVHYAMYAAPLVFDQAGAVIGLGEATLLSEPGSANTCGWFHPSEPGLVLFGSTTVPPREENQPGYQRATGKYAWSFPTEMDIVRARWTPEAGVTEAPFTLFTKQGYTAEASWSRDARYILYAQVDDARSERLGRGDADLYVFDTSRNEHTRLIDAEGYDGGPFFRPDGRWICYRSDRRGDNLLQLFVAELAFDDAADPERITGVRREVALTDNEHVNWAPFWDPSGQFLIYATSEVSHGNYEVFAVPVFDGAGGLLDKHRPVRVTNADGFDGLPVFSPDGRWMMWTAQRGPLAEGEARRSSQLWIARVDVEGLRSKLGVLGE